MFIDFENVARGVKEAQYKQFEVKLVLERLLEKGKIIVRRAYADWNRFTEYKRPLHEWAIELIDVPQSRYSGKNSADIRMVVDALDLCYTKSHVDTFVIISGDSDFSPLVSKLRENDKTVIGVGVKNSTSDLLIANCDEFIFYDDLVREKPARRRAPAKKAAAPKADAASSPAPSAAAASTAAPPVPAAEPESKKSDEDKKQEALELILQTIEALGSERGDDEKIWGSMVKQALKRRKPGFNEAYYGYRSFNKLLEEAAAKHLVNLERDEKSGGYIIRMLAHEE